MCFSHTFYSTFVVTNALRLLLCVCGLMLLFLGTQQWKCFKCWPLYFCLVHATGLVHLSFLLIVYTSPISPLLLSFRAPMRLPGPFCKYCCYGLSNSFFFFCSHQPFGRNEKLKFPSEIPYHQEVCVNSTHTLAFGTRNSLLRNDSVCVLTLTSWFHQMERWLSGSTQKG